MNIYEQVMMTRQSMAVKRFHILRTHRTQTVGEHSGAVATLLMLVHPECSAMVLKAALAHDFHERSTGDMPSTAKSLHPELAEAMQDAEDTWNSVYGFTYELAPFEAHLLKWCDYMELLLWSIEECGMGNTYAQEAIDNITPALLKLGPPNEAAKELINTIMMNGVM